MGVCALGVDQTDQFLGAVRVAGARGGNANAVDE